MGRPSCYQVRTWRLRNTESLPRNTLRERAAQSIYLLCYQPFGQLLPGTLFFFWFSFSKEKRSGPFPKAFLQPLLTRGHNSASDLIQSRWKAPLGAQSMPLGVLRFADKPWGAVEQQNKRVTECERWGWRSRLEMSLNLIEQPPP